ncbi:MAG: hypothetical protein GXO40_02775 [Epsilonproteobacteria bacterium]|jgi:hypothetical protein|nr:hypothetical protein [Campylobacterota bacterium]
MIILNDKRFSDEIFSVAQHLHDIDHSPNNSTILWKYDNESLMNYKFCQQNNIPYAVEIETIEQFIFIINLDAKYAFCNDVKFAKTLQKLADHYLTQTKVILKTTLDEISIIAQEGIDGVFVVD